MRLGILVAVLLAAVGVVFPIWIAATVGDSELGQPLSTIVTVGFVGLMVGLVIWRMRRDG